MSRSRPIDTPHGSFWIDNDLNGQKPKHEQLEVLAANLNLEMDDVFDTYVTQGEVVKKLRKIMGQVPPEEVTSRITAARAMRQTMPKCRGCEREGDSTQHHFVNKWILKELEYYEQKWSSRKKNCIPVCIDCHRDFHSRENGAHSIADLLTDEEKQFAEAALSALSEERPKLLILIARGSDSTYETRLVRDWLQGMFASEEVEPSCTVAHLRVV